MNTFSDSLSVAAGLGVAALSLIYLSIVEFSRGDRDFPPILAIASVALHR